MLLLCVAIVPFVVGAVMLLKTAQQAPFAVESRRGFQLMWANYDERKNVACVWKVSNS